MAKKKMVPADPQELDRKMNRGGPAPHSEHERPARGQGSGVDGEGAPDPTEG